MPEAAEKQTWLNRTVLGVGLTSLFSDWSHETATAVLPAFLAMIGAGPAWLGAIEGLASAIPLRKVTVRAKSDAGRMVEFVATVRIDTPQEREYYRHGGILQYVLRQLLKT